MLLSFILLIPLTLQTIKCDEKIIPVLMIDYSGLYSGAPDDLQEITNPFRKISTAQFADIVQIAIKMASVVIIFIEEQFCVEDISTKDAFGTPYQHLHKALTEDKVKYFPKVIEPYKLLNQVFEPLHFNIFHLGSEVNLKMFEEKNNYLYVFFRDGKDETRVEQLRRHDVIMKEVYTTMMKLAEGPVLAFYTGKRNPVNVDKVDFLPILPNPGQSFPGVTVVTDGALFWFFGVYAATPTRRALLNQMPILAEETWTDHALSTKVAYSDFDLKFDFTFSETEWMLETVMLFEGGEEVGRSELAVRAPWDHAYYCAEPMAVINRRDGSTVSITEYKQTKTRPNNVTMIPPPVDGTFTRGELQRRRRNDITTESEDGTSPSSEGNGQTTPSDGTTTKANSQTQSECGFGPTVNCGPYVSVGILSALFVVGICLVFLGFGLLAINDCKTNDRYDDPRGKLPVLGVER